VATFSLHRAQRSSKSNNTFSAHKLIRFVKIDNNNKRFHTQSLQGTMILSRNALALAILTAAAPSATAKQSSLRVSEHNTGTFAWLRSCFLPSAR
jgi:hypothetical protein